MHPHSTTQLKGRESPSSSIVSFERGLLRGGAVLLTLMKRTSLLVLMLCCLVPSPFFAWGLEIHRFISDQAICVLPAALRPFFEKHRAFIVEHSVDPDLWRNMGFLEEPPRHFLDLDAFGSYPFRELPREKEAAIRRFGKERIDKEGQVPWRTVEIYQRLAQAFEQLKAGTNLYAMDDIKFFSAALSHYVSDAHVPFHAAKNYDGQMTNQHGIHSRFETELVLRYRERLNIRPLPIHSIANPLDFIFEELLKSFTYVEPILKADREAARGREEYDDAYFDKLFFQIRPILEGRLNDSITSVASMIVSAWEKAGRPELPLEIKRNPKKILRENP